ncbi:MAG: extracellular substrate binding-like orphan protein GrrP [Synechococcaceae cyanobacterium]|nr:extracellular substrate binding-like orphan protein GrrP [Synechococcaceae cyanobacterium]
MTVARDLLPADPRGPRPRRRRHALRGLLLLAALLPGSLTIGPARAGTLLEQAVRSGELVMVGSPDTPPFVSLNARGEPVGYAIDVGRRIDAALQKATGSKVQLRFRTVPNAAAAAAAVSQGQAALACGVPFSWELDRQVDFSLPIGLSGLRLLVAPGGPDGSAASLAGQSIAVIKGSLGVTLLPSFQPAARPVSFDRYEDAVTALQQGQVSGVMGDTFILSGQRLQRNISNYTLVPQVPYRTYGVGCITPENNSDFANIVNLTIAKLMQGYIGAQPAEVVLVERWVGPEGVLRRSREQVKAFFQTVLFTRESLGLSGQTP